MKKILPLHFGGKIYYTYIMKMQKTAKIIAVLLVALSASTVSAERLRLKYQTTVDVLDDAGKLIGQRKLKPGAILEAPQSDEDEKNVVAAKKGRLVPSDVSPTKFLATRKPSNVVLRAEISLSDIYWGQFDSKKGRYWSVDINAKNADWSYGERIYGYVPKSSPVGKSLIALIEDGKDHACLVQLTPVRDEFHDNLVMIKDFEPVEIKE